MIRKRTPEEHAGCGLPTRRVWVTMTLPDGREVREWFEMGSGRASQAMLKLPTVEDFAAVDWLMRERKAVTV